MTIRRTIGVLALQGAVSEHASILTDLGAHVILVRRTEHLNGLDGLVIPGGESTAIARIAAPLGLFPAVRNLVSGGLPVFGTCAGLILLAHTVEDADALAGFDRIATLDITAQRNAYGNQLASREAPVDFMPTPTVQPVAAFIRAPHISSVGPRAKVIATADGVPVAVQQDNQLAATFHPEITGESAFHHYFLSLV
ncbi:pyridoxal 5'-phosphate synthase glutaminase subunit PdxT [Jonesia quinghaiensis]|uniref:pyridoxal 5'-phosphate synthase glutaminase subunit PdxT n=1 Tax=Jonesia quinghaiensis TaxID=262806 RepID=UPI00041D998B|nr:pyridoxal 5'-phosphate synthase glutaminase subunit PdxT [Jonesia quinghaiensis]